MGSVAFSSFLVVMAVIAFVVFIALYFVKAGYGLFFDRKWGVSLNNKIAWMLMEAPVFGVMLGCWWGSGRKWEVVPLVFFLLFEFHYFRRSFIFPFLMRGKSRMPVGIMGMGILFNVLNGIMQGVWIFYLAPEQLYTVDWLLTPQFMVGMVLFMAGMGINIHSDRVIRNLRRPGDQNHYLPEKGMFRYVTSANYFGEIVEWTGFAVMTWSWAGAVFAWWTAANLVPRADKIYHRYRELFGQEKMAGRKRVFPFLY